MTCVLQRIQNIIVFEGCLKNMSNKWKYTLPQMNHALCHFTAQKWFIEVIKHLELLYTSSYFIQKHTVLWWERNPRDIGCATAQIKPKLDVPIDEMYGDEVTLSISKLAIIQQNSIWLPRQKPHFKWEGTANSLKSWQFEVWISTEFWDKNFMEFSIHCWRKKQ